MAPCGPTAQIKTKVLSLPHSHITHVTLSDNCTCFLCLALCSSFTSALASLKHNMAPSCTSHQAWFSSLLAAALHHQRASHHTCVTHVALCNMRQPPCHALSCSLSSGARLVRLTKSDPTNIAEPMAALLATTSNFTAPERNTHHTLLGPLRRFQIQVLSSPCLTWRLVALWHKSKPKFQAFRIHLSRM